MVSQWALVFRVGGTYHIYAICDSQARSKPASSGEEKLRNKGNALKGHEECTRGMWTVIKDIMNAQLCTNLGNASGNGVMSSQ